ncbi:TetR/AcrR family transcriptional regulator [Actinocorallia sp. API 0066]|uniref:TetR/AcrR family transcriptional regulator n=1 Tax=Actinocorallia sp. API 0066 TaxID=2896846 RepID=UPI001E45AF4E|nr:TetR/AcrR family transcriptional regulator [Actinocorallia sp. API 0066]MCD0449367.1 TetR/AcrR family transcriptional regulator [Actinocorallia sp. API 0066]
MAAGRRVRKDRDERRAQILACARELFRSRRFEDVSAEEIAAAAGVSRGLLNHYFGTKRELYLAALAEMLDVPPTGIPPYRADAGLLDRVTDSVDGWLSLLEQNRETWLTALDRAAPRGDAQLDWVMEAARARAVARITEVVGLDAATAAHPQVEGVLHAFAGLAQTASREWLERERLSRAEVRHLLVSSLMHLIEKVIPDLVDGPVPGGGTGAERGSGGGRLR